MNWPQTKLHDVLQLNSTSAVLDEHIVYKQAALQPYPRGMFLKAVKSGLDFPHKRQKQLQSGQFIISKQHARQRVWGLVPDEFDGAMAALGYLVFDIQPGLLVDYFAAYLSTVLFRQAAFAACSQHGYLNIQQFADISLPLPSSEDQYRVAELWKLAHTGLEQTREMLSAIAALKAGVGNELFSSANSSWEQRKLSECAQIGQERTANYALAVILPDQILLNTSLFGDSGVGVEPDFELDLHYLYYYLENQKSVLRAAANPAELKARLKTLSIPLPTLYEQRKIALAMQQHDEVLLRIRAEQTELRRLIDGVLYGIFNGSLDLREALPILQRFSAPSVNLTSQNLTP
jgi:hypothetical protein